MYFILYFFTVTGNLQFWLCHQPLSIIILEDKLIGLPLCSHLILLITCTITVRFDFSTQYDLCITLCTYVWTNKKQNVTQKTQALFPIREDLCCCLRSNSWEGQLYDLTHLLRRLAWSCYSVVRSWAGKAASLNTDQLVQLFTKTCLVMCCSIWFLTCWFYSQTSY